VNLTPFFKIFGLGLWRMDYEKPTRTGYKLGKMQLSCFLKMFICRLILAQLCHRRGKWRTAVSPKLFKFREAGTQVSPVTMSCPPWQLLHPVYHWLQKIHWRRTRGLLLWCFLFFDREGFSLLVFGWREAS
jgi:hypothetical protein